MTGQGVNLAFEYLAGIRPAQEQTPEMIAVWGAKLARYDDDLVLHALMELADRPTDPKAPGGLPQIQIGDVLYKCKVLGNQRAIDAAAEKRDQERRKELTAGQRATQRDWGKLSPAERASYMTQAREHLLGLGLTLPDDAGEALARFLANGGDLDAPGYREPTPFPCRGCGRGLILVERGTETAVCEGDGCRAVFTLPDDWRQSTRPLSGVVR
jgi:hypothetical protein